MSGKKIDWHSIGYGRGIAAMTGGTMSTMYPHRDTYSEQDERNFIAGYNEALADFHTTGLRSVEFYVEERKGLS